MGQSTVYANDALILQEHGTFTQQYAVDHTSKNRPKERNSKNLHNAKIDYMILMDPDSDDDSVGFPDISPKSDSTEKNKSKLFGCFTKAINDAKNVDFNSLQIFDVSSMRWFTAKRKDIV